MLTPQVFTMSRCLTTQESLLKGKRTAMKSFSLQDIIRYYVAVNWYDSTKAYGPHEYYLQLVVGTQTGIHPPKKRCVPENACRAMCNESGVSLGQWTFPKVEILIDNKGVGAEEFTISIHEPVRTNLMATISWIQRL